MTVSAGMGEKFFDIRITLITHTNQNKTKTQRTIHQPTNTFSQHIIHIVSPKNQCLLEVNERRFPFDLHKYTCTPPSLARTLSLSLETSFWSFDVHHSTATQRQRTLTPCLVEYLLRRAMSCIYVSSLGFYSLLAFRISSYK